jgi:hypothetical protein
MNISMVKNDGMNIFGEWNPLPDRFLLVIGTMYPIFNVSETGVSLFPSSLYRYL